jgi:subtilisin-like proprotein convertase family protein
LVIASFNAGAPITSNSWGADIAGAYSASSQAYDALTRDAAPATAGNQQMLHVFSAGNAGPGGSTVGSPGTAKNVLTVGATESVRDQGIVDGCGHANADNADDLASFSARGPTDDGRVKPDIVAPGVHIQGAASQDPSFDGFGVCGGPGSPPSNRFYPDGQTLYTWSTGTSHSTPAVAGAASLLSNYYGRVLNPGGTPSPAMLKALLLNSPRYLTGAGAGDTLPSNTQGWGDVNLGSLFDGAPRELIDQSTLLTASGQEVTQPGAVASSGNPLRVTLAWTDAPGSTTGNAFVNDLDLEVTVGGSTYKGNVFSGATSSAGGVADTRNNVESVFLPAGLSGTVAVRIVARNLAGDGVPGNASTIDQDFALVTYNVAFADLPVLHQGAVTTGDANGNNNGFIDPGESITLLAAMQNVGTATATNVNGTLAVTGGSATVVTGSSPYPTIAPNATAQNSTPYRFVVSPSQPCGSLLTFQHTVTYTGGGPASTSLPVHVGKPTTGAPATYTSPNVPTAIPDTGAPTSVSLPISGVTGTIADINVRVNVTHTWDMDLVLQLVSPDGQNVVTLINRRGDSGDNFTNTVLDDEAGASISSGSAPFSGSFRPEAPLSVLDGLPINGTWQLKVTDVAAQDVGAVTGFQLDIVPQVYECATVTNGPDLSVSATDSPDPILQGGQLTYGVTATSTGATSGSPTVTIGLLGWDEDGLTSTCPGAFTLLGTPGNRSATCSVGQFAAAGNKTFTVTFAPQSPGTLANAVSISSAQPDQNPANNSVNVSTTVNSNAANCSPRPRVLTPVTRIGIGHLRTTVTALFGPIQYILFQKGLIDIQGGPSNQGPNFLYYPPIGTGVVTFDFHSSPPSEGITTNLTVKDGCGKWTTFVGMGTGPW